MPEISSKQHRFEEILTSAFNIEKFAYFAKEFLNGFQESSQWHTFNADNRSNFEQFVVGRYVVGSYETADRKNVIVLAVCLKQGSNVELARSKQRNYVKQIINNKSLDAALVAFYTENSFDKWRLSLVRVDNEFVQGKFKTKLSPVKRYSYLVGKDEPCNTAKQSLFPIYDNEANKPTLKDLETAFMVEKVTDEFFKLYREKFLQLQETLEANDAFVREAKERNFTSEQFAKKLMGQIVFLYFIQKKGWLGVDAFQRVMTEKEYKDAFYTRGLGELPKKVVPKVYQKREDGLYYRNRDGVMALTDEEGICLAKVVKGDPWGSGPKDFVRTIFKAAVNRGMNFFDDYLEPFFYTGLNMDRGVKGYYHRFRKKVPFLNGGLFEQLEGYDWQNNNFAIPNEIFSNAGIKEEPDGILDIFDRFNFTMNEEEPMEREVAIDPEMLGKVFENLLEIKDRKSKGAFYTPREIVHYMCQESLINYLTGKMGIPEEDIRDFVLYGDFIKDEDTAYGSKPRDQILSKLIYDREMGVNRLQELDGYLANVKVCDPAVGSGAFPLGMINEIVKLREALTAYMAMDIVYENGSNLRRYNLYNQRNLYRLKTQTIKNCIYACDIMPSAVDIAKLRLWLSIVIDDVLSDRDDELTDEHTSPRQLPNLDCNIICGNSLMDEFHGVKLINASNLVNRGNNTNTELFDIGIDERLRQIIALQNELFYTNEFGKKSELKQKIQECYNSVILDQLANEPVIQEDYYRSLTKISSPFVLWQLYFPKVFAENGGFDIVIGNPPYGAKISAAEKAYYKRTFKCSQTINNKNFPELNQKGSTDTFAVFTEKGLTLLRRDGVLAFIVPMSLISSDAMTGLQKIIEGNCKTAYISSYSNRPKQIFDAACIRTSIAILHYTKTGLDNLYMTKLQRRSEKMSIRQIIQELKYIDAKNLCMYGRYPKIGSRQELNILYKLMNRDKNVSSYIDDTCSEGVYYRAAGGRYYNVITDYSTGSSAEKCLPMIKDNAVIVGLFLSSSVFWMYQQIYTDGINLKQNEIWSFPLPDLDSIPVEKKEYVAKLYEEYEADLERNVVVHQSNSYNVSSYKEYKIGKSQRYVDLIDDITGELYGFTKEETEFIKNYEREFRVRDEE